MGDYKLINKISKSLERYSTALKHAEERLIKKKLEVEETIQQVNDGDFNNGMSEELLLKRVSVLKETINNLKNKINLLKNMISRRESYLKKVVEGNVQCRFWSDTDGCYVNGVIKTYNPNTKTFKVCYGDEVIELNDNVRIYAYLPKED